MTNHNDIIKSLQIIENLSWNHCKWSYFEIFKYILIEARSHQKQDVETFLKDFQLRIIENFKDEFFRRIDNTYIETYSNYGSSRWY